MTSRLSCRLDVTPDGENSHLLIIPPGEELAGTETPGLRMVRSARQESMARVAKNPAGATDRLWDVGEKESRDQAAFRVSIPALRSSPSYRMPLMKRPSPDRLSPSAVGDTLDLAIECIEFPTTSVRRLLIRILGWPRGIPPLVTNVNLPNRGQAGFLPEGAVVETFAAVSQDEMCPIQGAMLTAPAQALIKRVGDVQQMALYAIMARDSRAIVQALLLDPLVALPTDDAARLLDEMCDALRQTGQITEYFRVKALIPPRAQKWYCMSKTSPPI